ncbi:MAG TPA: YdeI/OmpD-associated family protein [Bacteroidota bacterium]|nr:YdeI/OmpD-associated family protein [Bacteroidota bacterium]
MGKKDKRVDVYIARAAEFAQPILKHIRQLVHAACPGVEETIKWGFPHFQYKGLLCSMAAFKQHCAFGFWKASLLSDSGGLLSQMGETAMGNFGQLRSLHDLPPDKTIINYVKEALRLNEDGVQVVKKSKVEKRKPLRIPAFFKNALNKNKRALATFESFSYSNKKEYVEWLVEAKTDATREKRLATTIEWLEQGKSRNWKYAR